MRSGLRKRRFYALLLSALFLGMWSIANPIFAGDTYKKDQEVQVYNTEFGWVDGTYIEYATSLGDTPHIVGWNYSFTKGNSSGSASGTNFFSDDHIRLATSGSNAASPPVEDPPTVEDPPKIQPVEDPPKENLPSTATEEPAGAAAGGKVSAADQDGILKVHNDARAEVGVGPLVWDASVASYAQEWAEHIARNKAGGHRTGANNTRQLGENIAQAGASSAPPADYGRKGSLQWYEEKTNFDTNNGGVTGHYTQMVWRKTTKIGCGLANYIDSGFHSVVLVCNYDPPGNFVGQQPY